MQPAPAVDASSTAPVVTVKTEPGIVTPARPAGEQSANPQASDLPTVAASGSAPKRPLDNAASDDAAEAAIKRVKGSEGPRESAGPKNQTSFLFCDPKADFEIISKEGISHRVRSYHLLSNSPFFQDLQDAGRMHSPLHLSDDQSTTIEDILSLMTRRPLSWALNGTAFVHRTTHLVAICKRWECEFLLAGVSAMIGKVLNSTPVRFTLIAFCCSVALNDPELSRQALPHAARVAWALEAYTKPRPGQRSLDTAEAGQSYLDVLAMPRWLIDVIPIDHRVALGRAYRLRGSGTSGGEGDWDKVAEEYYRLITEPLTPAT